MTFLRRIALATFAAPLALGLAGCNSGTEAEGGLTGEPVAEVAPPAGKTWSDTVAVTELGGYSVGNPEAPIKLIEYGSLTCPACAAFSTQGSVPLHEEYINSGRVNFEFRSFIIHGPLDLVLTRLIGCGSPEAAVPLADQIWANLGPIQQRAYQNQPALEAALGLPEDQRFVAFAEAAGLYDFFASRGLSTDQAKACLADFASLEKLANLSQRYANEEKVSKTPTFVLNGQEIQESAWDGVEAALQRAGAR